MIVAMCTAHTFCTESLGIGMTRRELASFYKKHAHSKEQHTHKYERYGQNYCFHSQNLAFDTAKISKVGAFFSSLRFYFVI